MAEKRLKPEEAMNIIAQQLPETLVEPTAEEARNGWTAERLTEYHRSAEVGSQMRLNPEFRAPVRPRTANSKYNPFRWRQR